MEAIGEGVGQRGTRQLNVTLAIQHQQRRRAISLDQCHQHHPVVLRAGLGCGDKSRLPHQRPGLVPHLCVRGCEGWEAQVGAGWVSKQVRCMTRANQRRPERAGCPTAWCPLLTYVCRMPNPPRAPFSYVLSATTLPHHPPTHPPPATPAAHPPTLLVFASRSNFAIELATLVGCVAHTAQE